MSSIGLKFIAVYTRAIYFIATRTVFPYKQNSPLDPQSERKHDARKKGTGHRFLDNHNCLFLKYFARSFARLNYPRVWNGLHARALFSK